MQELRQNLEISKKALIDHEVKEEKRQREIDKILMTSKRRCQGLEVRKSCKKKYSRYHTSRYLIIIILFGHIYMYIIAK